MLELILQKYPNINKIRVARYLKYLDSYQPKPGERVEKHHILPYSLFPEYKKSKWNIKKLSVRAHYLAHFELAKIFGGKMWFAFNQMQRAIPNNKKTSVLYELVKNDIHNNLMLMVSSRSKEAYRTVEFRKSVSDRSKGKVTVKNQQGETFLTSVDDPLYKSGHYVYYRTGSKHTEKTKAKMSNSRKKYTKIINNGVENKYIKETDIIEDGWSLGRFSESNEKYGKSVASTVWITREDGSYDRIKEDDYNGELLGRVGFNGFAHINSGKTYVDLINKKHILVLNGDEVKDYYVKTSGQKIENYKVYIHNGFIMLGWTLLQNYLDRNGFKFKVEAIRKLEKEGFTFMRLKDYTYSGETVWKI